MSKINISIVYVHRDAEFLELLKSHFRPLEKLGGVVFSFLEAPLQDWHDRQYDAFNATTIAVLLVSLDFLASDYIYGVEFQSLLKTHEEGKVKILPVILRPCNWQSSVLSKLQVIPSDGTPLNSYSRSHSNSSSAGNIDEGFYLVAEVVRYAIEDIKAKQKIQSATEEIDETTYKRHENVLISHSGEYVVDNLEEVTVADVFPLSGIPQINFVEPIDFKKLMFALKHKGRGIVLEGPSGTGKTTAIKKAVQKLNLNGSDYQYLSARDPNNVTSIKTIGEWHKGLVVVDDFHRLDENVKSALSDYLKLQADIETTNKKLVIIGIPNTGVKLISFGHDLAMRLAIFKFAKVGSEKIAELIEKGEHALNIKFDNKTDIIIASNGSMSITQYLCHYSAVEQDVFETQKVTKVVSTNLPEIISAVKCVVESRFSHFILDFARLGGTKDKTCIKLLKELAVANNGRLNLEMLRESKPELSFGISMLMTEATIESLLKQHDDRENLLFYDPVTTDLITDDPQLLFYLNNTSESFLSKLSGKRDPKSRTKVFICYSHDDDEYYDRVMVHLRSIPRGQIDIWSDKRIKAGEKWNDVIQSALEETKVALLLISADFIASDYINEVELPALVKASSQEGAVILPVFLKPANLSKFEHITEYQGINTPDETLLGLQENEREKLFVRLAQRIDEIFELQKGKSVYV